MGYKSRSGWSIPICLKNCSNRYEGCEKDCFRDSLYKEVKDCIGKTEDVKRMTEKDDFQCA